MKSAKNLKNLPTASLVPYAKNARTHSAAQIETIAQSIEKFGFTNPVLIDGTGGIIAGHGRVLAALKLDMAEVPTLTIDHLTETEKRAYIIADNQIALGSGWNDELLQAEVAALMAEGFDPSILGFSSAELDDIAQGREGMTDEDVIPETPAVPVSKIGDQWVLGDHVLRCGDSTSPKDAKALMDGAQADLVWTDPPYNVAIVGAAGTIMNDDMSDAKFAKFLRKVYDNCYACLKPGGVIYVAHADTERVNFTAQFKASGLKLSQVLIWAKQSGTLSRQDFNWKHEPVLYGWKEGAAHYFCGDFTLTSVIDDDIDINKLTKPQLLEIVNQMRTQEASTVLRYNRPTISDLHPTMKPVHLVERMVIWSSRRGDIVLDLFGGSGSTLIACEKASRHARIMEMDPRFVDVIIKRWQDFTGNEAILQDTNKTFAEVKAKREKS